jgi:hypothetical protein
LGFSIGVFLGFSPFLGLHTLAGLAVAFVLRLNRAAVLLGAWSNTPWWLVPYYMIATWVGTKLVGYRFHRGAILGVFRHGMDHGFVTVGFWEQLVSHRGLFLSFWIGSFILSLFLGLVAYPLSLKWIKFYRSRRQRQI